MLAKVEYATQRTKVTDDRGHTGGVQKATSLLSPLSDDFSVGVYLHLYRHAIQRCISVLEDFS